MQPVYSDSLVSLYHGDCVDVIEDVLVDRSVALLLTDPPYGQSYDGKGSTSGANLRGDGARGGMRTLRRALSALEPKLLERCHVFSFCHFESHDDFRDTLAPRFDIRGTLVWDKGGGGTGDTECDFARNYELVLHAQRGRRPLLGSRDGAMLRGHGRASRTDRVHPTQKPESLLRYLVSKSVAPGAAQDGIVFDPFGGSASTLIACRQLGIRAVAVEIDARWIPGAVEWLSQPELTIDPPQRSPVAETLSLGLDVPQPSPETGAPEAAEGRSADVDPVAEANARRCRWAAWCAFPNGHSGDCKPLPTAELAP